MAQLNILSAFETLGLPENLLENAYRFLLTLEDRFSSHYNPHAAQTIRSLLTVIANNGPGKNRQRDYFTVLLLGQMESLLLTNRGGLEIDNMDCILSDPFLAHVPHNKANFQEKIDSLLYGREERRIVAMENYCPKIYFGDEGSSLMIHISTMRYLNSTPDIEQRQRRLQSLKNASKDPHADDNNKRIAFLLAKTLESHIDDRNNEGGEAFERLMRRLLNGSTVPEDLIKRSIRARNTAVHDGLCRCGNDSLCLYLSLLFTSDTAIEKGEPEIEKTVAEEAKRERRARLIRKSVTAAISTVVIGITACFLCIFVTGLFIGPSDIERVRWDTNSSQLNARINELIATKDTTQLIQAQRELQWIDNVIYHTSE